jgi:hypothetical protein
LFDVVCKLGKTPAVFDGRRHLALSPAVLQLQVEQVLEQDETSFFWHPV